MQQPSNHTGDNSKRKFKNQGIEEEKRVSFEFCFIIVSRDWRFKSWYLKRD